MGKAIGLLLAVAAIWVTVEIYTQGPDAAFGGRLAQLTGDSDSESTPRGSTTQRAGAAVERAHSEHEDRYRDLIPE
jgi:hypothetical protein